MAGLCSCSTGTREICSRICRCPGCPTSSCTTLTCTASTRRLVIPASSAALTAPGLSQWRRLRRRRGPIPWAGIPTTTACTCSALAVVARRSTRNEPESRRTTDYCGAGGAGTGLRPRLGVDWHHARGSRPVGRGGRCRPRVTTWRDRARFGSDRPLRRPCRQASLLPAAVRGDGVGGHRVCVYRLAPGADPGGAQRYRLDRCCRVGPVHLSRAGDAPACCGRARSDP